MEDRFTEIYKKNLWGNGSGGGSTIEFNKDTYNPFIINFIKEHNIKSVVDAACGDWQSSYLIYDQLQEVEYNGYDIVEFLIEDNKKKHPRYNFHHLDFCANPEGLKPSDLLILKDVIQHWPIRKTVSFLDRIIELNNFKYILISNSSGQTQDHDIDDERDNKLSCNFFPLNKYKGEIVYTYEDKEVSLIKL